MNKKKTKMIRMTASSCLRSRDRFTKFSVSISTNSTFGHKEEPMGDVNYPPLMRGIPRLEVGASAPWSFSFPAYEESSLQDDCNHPNLTISTGDPRRPVRFIHNEGLSFLCVRMSCCARHPFRLIQDISCYLLIPVHGMSAYRAEIRPVGQF